LTEWFSSLAETETVSMLKTTPAQPFCPVRVCLHHSTLTFGVWCLLVWNVIILYLEKQTINSVADLAGPSNHLNGFDSLQV